MSIGSKKLSKRRLFQPRGASPVAKRAIRKIPNKHRKRCFARESRIVIFCGNRKG